mmetsp:Transcript_86076/g.248536  ORF Transcript_86076/g.248536 Transcript_86076/m.248536 type:complete len:275 (-) Transcript_86076:406-1230(-)
MLFKLCPRLRVALLVIGMRKQPTAFLVLDVGANLAELLRIGKRIQVVVLSLEVDAHHQQHLPRGVEGGTVPHSGDQHRQSNRQVEGVEGCLVLHYQCPPLQGKLLEAAVRAARIQQLPALGLEGSFQEEVHQPSEVLLLSEVAFQHFVDEHLDHEKVVRVEHANFGPPVPTRMASPGERPIHHVIGHEHASLEELHGPTQHRKTVQVAVRRFPALALHQADAGLDNDEPAVHLAAEDVVLERLPHPIDLFPWHLVQVWQLLDQLLQDALADALE